MFYCGGNQSNDRYVLTIRRPIEKRELFEIFKHLFVNKVDVNEEEYEGYTTLHHAAFAAKEASEKSEAAYKNSLSIIQLLLICGANENFKNEHGNVPIPYYVNEAKKSVPSLLTLAAGSVVRASRAGALAEEDKKSVQDFLTTKIQPK